MNVTGRGFGLPLCFVGMVLLAVGGCNSSVSASSSSASSSAAELSGPPVPNEAFGAREPRKCAALTSVPTPAQAAVLVQCDNEGYLRGDTDLILVTGVTVEMGSSRAANYNDSTRNDLDSSTKVYPLRGSMKRYDCGLVATYGAGTNCQTWPPADGMAGTGLCWHTTFGDWRCNMSGWSQAYKTKQPAPTTY